MIGEIVRWRREHQPGGQNAGSVFVNPVPFQLSAGEVIDELGLRGLRIGSAQVSEKHANFIQADEGGSADDVRAVMEAVRAAGGRPSGASTCAARSAWSGSRTSRRRARRQGQCSDGAGVNATMEPEATEREPMDPRFRARQLEVAAPGRPAPPEVDRCSSPPSCVLLVGGALLIRCPVPLGRPGAGQRRRLHRPGRRRRRRRRA